MKDPKARCFAYLAMASVFSLRYRMIRIEEKLETGAEIRLFDGSGAGEIAGYMMIGCAWFLIASVVTFFTGEGVKS